MSLAAITTPRKLLKISPDRKSLDAELYGLGRTLRHLQPPGGKETGIFDAFKLPPVATPRKVKDHFKSHVFDPPEVSLPRPVTPANATTFYHLFGGSPPKTRQRKANYFKSSLFDPDPLPKPPTPFVKQNPITGEACKCRDAERKLKSRKVRNPITFEGIVERYIRSRCTQAPGGNSTIVLEYIE